MIGRRTIMRSRRTPRITTGYSASTSPAEDYTRPVNRSGIHLHDQLD